MTTPYETGRGPQRYDEPLDPPLDAEPRPVPDEQAEDAAVEEAAADTGANSHVAAAVARLDALGDPPPAEHVEVYEDVHRVLQDALADAARGDQQQ